MSLTGGGNMPVNILIKWIVERFLLPDAMQIPANG